MSSFKKAFRKTTKEDLEFIEKLRIESKRKYLELGFSSDEYEIIQKIEAEEEAKLRSFETFIPRSTLLENGTINSQTVKNDIRKYRKRLNI